MILAEVDNVAPLLSVGVAMVERLDDVSGVACTPKFDLAPDVRLVSNGVVSTSAELNGLVVNEAGIVAPLPVDVSV